MGTYSQRLPGSTLEKTLNLVFINLNLSDLLLLLAQKADQIRMLLLAIKAVFFLLLLLHFGLWLLPRIRCWIEINLSFAHNPSVLFSAAAAAAKSLQSCPTLCDPIDGSPRGSPIPGILQARTLEWVAISFSYAWKWKVKVKSLSHVQLLATPWTAAHQAPPSMGFSRQECWSGVPLPSPLCFYNLWITHYSLHSLA